MAERRAREGEEDPRDPALTPTGQSLGCGDGLKRIIHHEGLDESCTVQQAVESVLCRMAVEPSIAERIAKLLGQWIHWTERGGMNMEYMDFLKENRRFMLCFVHDAVGSTGFSRDDAGVASDMQECTWLYRKVRLC